MRTFIAIDINDDELIKKIYELSLAVKRTGASLKLVEPENLHITLKFLGEIDPKDIDIIKKVIETHAKKFSPFRISIEKLGAFPSIRSPRVIWVGIEENKDKIVELAQAISYDLEKIGFRREKREFHPHVTIARVKKHNRALIDFINANKDKYFGTLTVGEILIKKSKLTPMGPEYTTIASIQLPISV